MSSKIVVVTDPTTGESRRFNISGAVELGWGPLQHPLSQRDWATGVNLEHVYLQPRAKRVIVEFYSRWDDGHGRCQGTEYTVADNDLIARIAREFNSPELAALLPEFVDE